MTSQCEVVKFMSMTEGLVMLYFCDIVKQNGTMIELCIVQGLVNEPKVTLDVYSDMSPISSTFTRGPMRNINPT